VDDPEVEPARWKRHEPAGDPRSGTLVPVDAPDDQDPARAGEVPELVNADRPSAYRVAEHHVPLLGRLRRGAGERERHRGQDGTEAHEPATSRGAREVQDLGIAAQRTTADA
jgi:hypothetical protein